MKARSFPDDVDVAVVAHNAQATLPRVLTCLAATGAPSARITLYDIASADDTAGWLGGEWPAVRVVRLASNDGPNPARNRAISDATRPYLLLVDSDAFLQPGAVEALRGELGGDGRVGAVVPIVVHAHEPNRVQYAGSSLHFICEAITPWADRTVAERGAAINDIGTAPGVCFLLDVAAAKSAGMFDTRYFMGKEDGEFCYRLRVAGYRLVETPAAIAEHGSRPRSTWLYPFQIRNRWHFILKNYEGRTLTVLAPALLVHEMVQFVTLTAKGHAGAWFRAARELTGWLPSLATDRRAVARFRIVHDRALLEAAPLVVRADVVGGALGRGAKAVYDSWLSFYWRATSWMLR